MEYILAKKITVKLFNFILGLFLTLISLSTSKKRVKRSQPEKFSDTGRIWPTGRSLQTPDLNHKTKQSNNTNGVLKVASSN